jgi:Domain of unknown function (DUF929)
MAGDGKAGRRGKASAGGQGADRRARMAAQRAAAQRAQRRNRMLIAGGAIVAVVAVVIALVALSSSSSSNNASGTATGPPPTGSALATVIAATTTVPATTLNQVGAGQVSAPPTTISGTPLTSGGKPEMLYMGAEYCPFCAAERWAMVVALSRFGTFSGLAAIRSAAKDGAGRPEPFPDTPTWTFANAHFTSTYLAFTPVELYTNVPDPSTGGYTVLHTPTAAQQALMTKYDASGSIPFVDYGNRYLSVGASYDQSVLTGLNWGQIAADLHNPASPVAKGVLGTANYMTAAICRLTGDRPASACTPVVKSLQAKL